MATHATLKRLRWQAAHLWRSIGLPGHAAAALLVAVAALWWGATLPTRDEARRLDTRSAALERRLLQRGATRVAVETAPSEQLAAFEGRFDTETSIASALAGLNAAARKHGIQLDQGEFKLVRAAGEPLTRYTILLPVKADYRSLRRFTKDALRDLPGLAMEEASLRRSDLRTAVLEAQLRFVLFLRKSE